MAEHESDYVSFASDNGLPDAGVDTPLGGEASLRRQIAAIADERGLDPPQVIGAETMKAMPAVPPLAFAAITAIFDCLFEADGREAAAAQDEDDMEPGDSHDG